MSKTNTTMVEIIAQELNIDIAQVDGIINLMNQGVTIPFMVHFCKPITQGLKAPSLRKIKQRFDYYQALAVKRELILDTIAKQDKLTPLLKAAIIAAPNKIALEDLFTPFRPKHTSKALTAINAGFEPLAQSLLDDKKTPADQLALVFVTTLVNVPADEALAGAREIIIERLAQHAAFKHELREYLWQHARLKATLLPSDKKSVNKYTHFRDYATIISSVSVHEAYRLFVGRRENKLKLTLALVHPDDGMRRLSSYFLGKPIAELTDWWLETISQVWQIQFKKFEHELMARLRETADEKMIEMCAHQLYHLLSSAPAGKKITLGLHIDGRAGGVKAVVIDANGQVLDSTVCFPFASQAQWHQTLTDLVKIVAKNNVNLIAMGCNGNVRGLERLINEMIKMYPDLMLLKIAVSDVGANAYAQSKLSALEYPALDECLRSALSIAKRAQDPLAELVKIEPKYLASGPHKADINPSRLAYHLQGVIEDCVNAVGVDLNTAAAPLLNYVSGLDEAQVKKIIAYRAEQGLLLNREQLKQCLGFDEQTYNQAAGFLRINNGTNPLDALAIHPKDYPLIDKILTLNALSLDALMTNQVLLDTLNLESMVDEHWDLTTIKTVVAALKPVATARPVFKVANFTADIDNIDDLQKDMIVTGMVSGITNFGAFVDVGVNQNGLVHISEMTHRFISDPHTIVKLGDLVKVRIIELDKARKRIGLSMKLKPEKSLSTTEQAILEPNINSNNNQICHKKTTFDKKVTSSQRTAVAKKPAAQEKVKKTIFNTAMADALMKLKKG